MQLIISLAFKACSMMFTFLKIYAVWLPFKGRLHHWFLEELIPSNHLVFKIHIIKLICENFIKISLHVFKRTANNGFYFIKYFVHVHIINATRWSADHRFKIPIKIALFFKMK